MVTIKGIGLGIPRGIALYIPFRSPCLVFNIFAEVVRLTVTGAEKGRRVRMMAKTGNDLELFRENAPSVSARECVTRALGDKNTRRHLVSI